MHEGLSPATLRSLMGVTVSSKQGKKKGSTYALKTIESLTEEIENHLEAIKQLSDQNFSKAHFVIWKWSIRQDYYDTHLRGMFSHVLLEKHNSHDFDAASFAEAIQYNVQTITHKHKRHANCLTLRYIYRIWPQYVSLDSLAKADRLFVIS